MNEVSISGKLLNRLASALHEARPDWDEPGILDALSQAAKLPRCDSPFALIMAGCKAARDGKNRTPAVIPLDGQHWREDVPANPRDKPAYYGPTMCVGCGEHGHTHPDCPMRSPVAWRPRDYQAIRRKAGLGPRETYVPPIEESA